MSAKPKVLVVDDDLDVLEMLEEFVTLWGYAPVIASNPDEAMRKFTNDPEIHLVLLDYIMPGWNGIQLARALKAERPDCAILLHTGGHYDLLIPEAAVAGVRKVLPKGDYRWLQEELAVARISRGL